MNYSLVLNVLAAYVAKDRNGEISHDDGVFDPVVGRLILGYLAAKDFTGEFPDDEVFDFIVREGELYRRGYGDGDMLAALARMSVLAGVGGYYETFDALLGR